MTMTTAMKTVKIFTKDLSMPCRKKVHLYLGVEDEEDLVHQLPADVSKLNYQLERFYQLQQKLIFQAISLKDS